MFFYDQLMDLFRQKGRSFRVSDWKNHLQVHFSEYLEPAILSVSPQNMYRCRPYSKDLPKKVKELWVPPKEKISIGRCNLPKQQILYACTCPYTSCCEADPPAQSNICIIRYKCNHLHNLSVTGDNFSTHFNLRAKGTGEVKPSADLGKIFSREALDGEEEDFYRLTNALFQLITKNTTGLAYPPAQTNNGSINFALFPDLTEELLIPSEVLAFAVISKNNREIVLKRIASAFEPDVDGNLLWQQEKEITIPLSEVEHQFTLIENVK